MSFKVSVRPSGRQFPVEGDETILEAALRNGVQLPYGCKSGACGTCKAQGLAGEWVQGAHAASALSAQEAQERKLLVCCSKPLADVVIEARELAGIGEIQIKKMPCRIEKIERVAPDVAVVSLQLPAGERLQFLAGQYLDFILRDKLRRSYSIATAPHSGESITLHIRHMAGGAFTDALFDAVRPTVKERDILRLEGPLGTFFLREDSTRPIILLASGTGFAPIKAIAEHVFHRRLNRDEPGKPARKITFYWGCRTRKDLYMHALAQKWAAEQPNFVYVPVLSEPLPEDAWTGRTGFVHRAVMQDWPDLSGHQVYACGAPIMVQSARQDFVRQCKLPEDQFFADAFTSQADLSVAQAVPPSPSAPVSAGE